MVHIKDKIFGGKYNLRAETVTETLLIPNP